MKEETKKYYLEVIKDPDPFQNIPDLTKATMLRQLIQAGVEVDQELVNRYLGQVED